MAVLPAYVLPQPDTLGEGPFVGSVGVVNGAPFGSLVYANSYPAGVPYSTYSLSGTFIPGQAIITTAQGVVVAGTNFCYNYDYFAPLTGATVVLTQSYSIINPAGLIAALTISLPAAPYPGQVVHVSFSQVVTALTVNNGGGSASFIGSTPTAGSIGGHFAYFYEITSNAWYPI